MEQERGVEWQYLGVNASVVVWWTQCVLDRQITVGTPDARSVTARMDATLRLVTGAERNGDALPLGKLCVPYGMQMAVKRLTLTNLTRS